ncbi:MAG: alginate lyase family protein [Bacteroidota bacterium]|nr:alginate lyase family protein [Bacteroidota bacterium]
MLNFKHYFGSISGFNAFLIGLSRRINEVVFRKFSFFTNKSITRAISKIDNDSFISSLRRVIEVPSEADLQVNDLTIALLGEADLIIEGYVDLLGSGKVLLNPVNWHVDFKTGYEWPKGIFFRDYDQELLKLNCDVKVPRELSRSHHILKVALAYKITQDEKYAKYCLEQISNWIDENPLMFSINWGCTMDVAIRAINWIYIFRLTLDYEGLEDNFINKVKRSLYEHGWYIFRNPEKGVAYNHNHYLSDLSGQIYLGMLFNELEEPVKWLDEAKVEFFKEIRLQILPSGMSYERTTNYNRLVLELAIWPILLLKSNGHEIPYDIWYRMEKMFEFIMVSLKPDGQTSVIGDQDNGRLLVFGPEEELDYRYLLGLGSILFGRGDMKFKSGGYNLYSAFSGLKNPIKIFDKILPEESNFKSKLFKDIGIAIMRKEDNFLLFNVSGMAKYPESNPGSHTHSDLLSFELFAFGKTFLVDPGTYLYSADISQRMLFRSTKMHNTVVVDGFSQNNLFEDRPWYFERNAIPEILEWTTNCNFDQIKAKHSGFTRLPDPIIHTRTLKFDKNKVEWEITDELTGSGRHVFEWHFHFDVGIDFDFVDNSVFTTCDDNNNLELIFSENFDLNLRKESSFVSKSYGSKKPSNQLVLSAEIVAPVKLNIRIKKKIDEADF